MEKNISQSEISADIDVIHMCSENFKDALFFLGTSKKETDEYKKRRYLRASCVFFCATVESWGREEIVCQLKNKTNLSSKEQDILDRLTNKGKKEYFVSVRELFDHLFNVFNKTHNPSSDKILEEYRDLTSLRNDFIHYSERYEEEQYNIKDMEKKLDDIPKNIGKIIGIFTNLNGVCWYNSDMNNYSSC